MKNKFLTLLLAAALLAGLSGSVTAQSPASAEKIGVLNIQRAIVESNEGKQAADKLQTQFAAKRNELQAMQTEIEKLQKQLRDQEKTLSDDARAALVRKLEGLQKDYTRKTEDAQTDWQQAEGTVINEIGQKMMKVVEDYGRKNGLTMIVDVSSPQSPFLWWTSGVEITDEIIKLYNASSGATPSVAPAAKPAGTPAAKPPAPPATKKETPPATKKQ